MLRRREKNLPRGTTGDVDSHIVQYFGGGKGLKKRQPFNLQEKSPVPTTYVNAKIALVNMGVDCRYDVFHNRIVVAGFECSGQGDAEQNLDNVTLKVRDRIIRQFGFDPGKTHIYDAVVSLSLDNTFDPVLDYLDALEWDGVPRIDTWLVRWLGVADTRLNREIGRKMLLAGVRRVKEPGCKFDNIVVLEGKQGSGRSTLLKILAVSEENFSDAEVIALYPKERQEQIQGVWIYELAEMAGFGKVDTNQFKNFVSQTVDRARPAFGRSRIDRKRRCILIGTTNDPEYLKDKTGNRRYWPVKMPEGWEIDLDGFRRERDQLWAEAVVMEGMKDGAGRKEPLVISQELWDDVAVEQRKRELSDPWEEILSGLIVDGRPGPGFAMWLDETGADKMGEPEWRIASADLLENVLNIPKSRQYPTHSTRLAGVMRKLGWEKPDAPFKIKKKSANGFRRPKGTVAQPEPVMEILPPLPPSRGLRRI